MLELVQDNSTAAGDGPGPVDSTPHTAHAPRPALGRGGGQMSRCGDRLQKQEISAGVTCF